LESNWRMNVIGQWHPAFQPTLAARLVADPTTFVYNYQFFPGTYYVGKPDPAYLPLLGWIGVFRAIPPGASFPYGEIVEPD
jgi:hypothetical protein